MSPVNWPLEPGARVTRLVLVPEISPHAHLKRLCVRDYGIGALYKHTAGVSVRLGLLVIHYRENNNIRKQVWDQLNKLFSPGHPKKLKTKANTWQLSIYNLHVVVL